MSTALQHSQLDTSKGRVALAVRGGASTTWHGHGTEIMAGDSIETIMQKGGIDFEVLSSPMYYKDAKGDMREFDNRQVLLRSDTGKGLGTPSDNRYKIHQPRTIAEFFRDFASDKKLPIETCGALKGGRIMWMQARLGEDFDFILPGNDRSKSYLRLQTSYDCSLSTDGVATTTRQVCINTCEMINREAVASGYKVPHTNELDIKALQAAFGLLGKQHRITAKLWNELCKRQVSEKETKEYFCKVWGIEPANVGKVDKKTGEKLVSAQAEKSLAALIDAYKSGPGAELKSAKGTAYGLLNAVTYFCDHQARVNDNYEDGKDSARKMSNWFGINARTKKDAEYFAAELAGCEELLQAA